MVDFPMLFENWWLVGKLLAIKEEGITNAMTCNYVLQIYWLLLAKLADWWWLLKHWHNKSE